MATLPLVAETDGATASVEDLLKQAHALRGQGRLDEAARRLARILTLEPDHGGALWEWAILCYLRADHAGAIAANERLIALSPEMTAAHANRAAALKACGRLDEAIAGLERAIQLAPHLPEPLYNLANILFQRQDLDGAATALRRSLECQPAFPDAWGRLGEVLSYQGDHAGAAACYRAQIALDPTHADAHSNLGIALRNLERPDEALTAYRCALALKPDKAAYHYNQALSLEACGQFEETIGTLRRAIALNPDHIGSHHILGRVLLLSGELEEGGAEYEWRPNNVTFRSNPADRFGLPVWDGRPTGGRSVVLVGEGGFGDVLQFVRYAPLVAERSGGPVALTYARGLQHIVRTLGDDDRILHNPEMVPSPGACAMFLSLPHLLGTTLDTIPARNPYLSADPERAAAWRTILGDHPGLRVGLAWETRNDRQRSVPVAGIIEALAPLPGVTLFSLQKGAGAEELEALPPEARAAIRRFPIDEGADIFKDTAALMTSLDLVITIDTAAAHLAGALGVPAWVLLPFVPDWRWLLDRDDTPWYPTMRLFRQRAPNDWKPVLASVAARLRRVASGEEAALWPVSPSLTER